MVVRIAFLVFLCAGDQGLGPLYGIAQFGNKGLASYDERASLLAQLLIVCNLYKLDIVAVRSEKRTYTGKSYYLCINSEYSDG